MPNKRKLRVFISYARQDHAFAEKLENFLRESHCEPWLDTKSMLAGTRWELVIEQKMVNADLILAIVSSRSAKKEGYVKRELKIALRIADEKLEDVPFLVPILTEEM
jgi:TIR domain